MFTGRACSAEPILPKTLAGVHTPYGQIGGLFGKVTLLQPNHRCARTDGRRQFMKSALVFAGPHRPPGGWSQGGTTVLMPTLVAPSVSYSRV